MKKDIQEYIDKGLIPDNPSAIAAIESGKLTLDDVANKWQAYQSSQKKKPAFTRAEPVEVEKDVSLDMALNRMVDKGELPPSQKALDAIKANKITIDEVQTKWNQFRSNNETVIGNDKATLNKPQDLHDELTKELDEIYTPKDMPELKTGEAVAKGLKDSAKDLLHIWEQFGQGLTFDVFDAPQIAQRLFDEEPSTMAYNIGKVTNVAGMFMGGYYAGALLKQAPAVGPFIKSLEAGSKAAAAEIKTAKFLGEGVKASAFAAKHGKAVGALAAEAAPLGFAVGTTKGLLRGDDWEDAFASGVIDAAMWTAGSAILYPVVAGAGALAGRRELGKLKKISQHLSEDEVIGRVKEMKTGEMIELLEAIPEAQRSTNQTKALMSLRKVASTQPESSVLKPLEFAEAPEISAGVIEAKSKEMVDALYSNADSPLKFMLDESPTLNTLYKNKDYVGILSGTDNMLRQTVKNRKTLGEIATLPFMTDATDLATMAAKSAVRRAEGKGYAGVDEDVFTSFFKDPSKENIAAMRKAVPDAKALSQSLGVAPRTFAKGKKGLTDIRLSGDEAGKVVNDYLETYYRTVATDGDIGLGEIGKLTQADAIARSATTMNVNFGRKMFDAIARRAEADWTVYVKPEFKNGVDLKLKAQSLVRDSAENLKKINDLKATLKEATLDGDAAVIASARKSIKNANASLAKKNRDLRDVEAQLAAFPKNDVAEIDKLVGEIYSPSKLQLGYQTKETQAYLRRFGYKDNPLYLRNNTEMAEMLQMMVAGGKDVGFSANEPWLKNMTKEISLSYFAPIIRKMRVQLGYNSPFEVFCNRIKDNNVRIKQGEQYYLDGLAKTGISEGTKTAKIAFKLGNLELNTGSPEFLALTPEAQRKALDASKYVRGALDELGVAENAELVRMGHKPIAYKENYMPHIPKQKGFIRTVVERFSSNKELDAEGSKVFSKQTPKKGDIVKPRNVHERHQSDTGEYTEDIVEAFKGRLRPALETIHNAHIVREIDVMQGFAPQGIGRVLQHMKEVISGNFISKADEMLEGVVKKGAETSMRVKAQGLILGSLNVMFQQATSAAMSLAISPRAALAATYKMFSKESDDLFKLSRNRQLASHLEGVDTDKALLQAAFKDGEGVIHGVKAGYNYYKKFLSYGFRKFDMIARKHAFVTALEHGKSSGLETLARQNGADPERVLIAYADDFADMIHGSFGQLDRPEAMRSALGRAILQFQSFSMNLATTMMYDLPRMAYKEGAYKVSKNLLEAGAAMSLINSVCAETGVPEPFDMAMAFPFLSTYRYGNAGLDDAIAEFIKNADSERPDKESQAWRGLLAAGSSVAFPGSKQVYKATSAFGKIASKRGKLTWQKQKLKGDDVNVPMAMAFGIYPQVQKQYEKKAFKKSNRRDAERYVKRKLFR